MFVWQLEATERAEALALLPGVVALFIPFVALNLALLPRNLRLALGLSAYAYASLVFWLWATDCFYGLVDPLAAIIALCTPFVLVRARLGLEKSVNPRRAFWVGIAQLIPTLAVIIWADEVLPL